MKIVKLAVMAFTCMSSGALAASPAYVTQINDSFAPLPTINAVTMDNFMAPVYETTATLKGLSNTYASMDRPAGGLSLITQTGEDNAATHTQTGLFNLGLINQTGYFNSASLIQTGNRNTGIIFQAGRNNSAMISQVGNNHQAMIVQNGNHNTAFISQR